MKYTKEERLDIGRQIYDGELTRYQAAEYYDINEQTARSYMRLYRQTHHLPPKNQARRSGGMPSIKSVPTGMEDYEAMNKEELIQELLKARIKEARLKKVTK